MSALEICDPWSCFEYILSLAVLCGIFCLAVLLEILPKLGIRALMILIVMGELSDGGTV